MLGKKLRLLVRRNKSHWDLGLLGLRFLGLGLRAIGVMGYSDSGWRYRVWGYWHLRLRAYWAGFRVIGIWVNGYWG